MREIKFRSWDTANESMDYLDRISLHHDIYRGITGYSGTNSDFFGDGSGKSHEWSHDIKEDGQWILMQYTGLKDKNDKEIYEGDIIKNYSKSFGAEFVIKEVKFTEFLMNYGYDHYEMGEIAEEIYEVIGNIYENPELLIKS